MKRTTIFAVSLMVMVATLCSTSQAQITFSRLDFDAFPFTASSIGPNAIQIDPDVATNGAGAVYIDANCGGAKGFDLTIPNAGNIFDQPQMGMAFRFRKFESRSDFFIRGGTQFYQSGNELYIAYRTADSLGGVIDYGPINTGYMLNADNQFHEYIFLYEQAAGLATVTVDNVLIWSNDGPDNLPLDWTGAPDAVVGTVMDGNCSGQGILDYAYFFIPSIPLPVEFEAFEANAEQNDAQLSWEMPHTAAVVGYDIERSQDGLAFTQVGHVKVDDGSAYTYRDVAPGEGRFYYRVRAVGAEGESTTTDVQSVQLVGLTKPSMEVWPNPVSHVADVHIALTNVPEQAQIQILDLNGRQVGIGIEDIRDARFKVNASALTPGIYLLAVSFDGQRLQQKLIVQ